MASSKQIMESFGLEKTSKIKSNPHPDTPTPAKPHPEASTHILNPSRDGDSPTALGSLSWASDLDF